MARNERLDYCSVGEPYTEIVGDVVKNGRRGSLTCNLTHSWRSGHVAYSSHLARITLFIALRLFLMNWSLSSDVGYDFSPATSMQVVANIRAGTGSNNVIPGELLRSLTSVSAHGTDR